jgi:signal transduction histidine kinase
MTPRWPRLADESERLATLRSLEVLDTPRDERFDRITRLASTVMSVPIALISFVDIERQWFKSKVGTQLTEVPRDESVCGYAIGTDHRGLLVVEDATADERFADLPTVCGDPHMRSYAGQVLRVEGRGVGTLCVIDDHPRHFTDSERAVLTDLAHWAEAELRSDHEHQLIREFAALQRRTEMVLAGVAEGVVGIDHDGTVAFINPAGRAMLHWADLPTAGVNFHAAAHAMHADGSPYPVDECPVTDVLRAGGSRRDLSGTFWRQDGQPLPADWSVGAVLEGTEVVGAVVVFDDASRRREVERMKEEFTSVVSHELRTPLTSLIGALELLDDGIGGNPSDEMRLMLDIAVRNAHRLNRLVDDIIDVERSSTGQTPLHRLPVNVGELLAAAVATVQGTAISRDIQVDVRSVDAIVWGDEHQLVQVLTNLLGNALRVSEAGSAVRLHAELEPDAVVISVGDDGAGIPTDALGHVFDRFWQVDASARRARGGSGLGLTIAKNIVEAHGGEISVTSTVGRGSTFTVRLPRRSRTVPVADERRQGPRPTTGPDDPPAAASDARPAGGSSS